MTGSLQECESATSGICLLSGESSRCFLGGAAMRSNELEGKGERRNRHLLHDSKQSDNADPVKDRCQTQTGCRAKPPRLPEPVSPLVALTANDFYPTQKQHCEKK